MPRNDQDAADRLAQIQEQVRGLQAEVAKWSDREAALATRELQRESDLQTAHQRIAELQGLLVREREYSKKFYDAPELRPTISPRQPWWKDSLYWPFFIFPGLPAIGIPLFLLWATHCG